MLSFKLVPMTTYACIGNLDQLVYNIVSQPICVDVPGRYRVQTSNL